MLIVLIGIAIWSTTGLLIAWGLRRQGHNFWVYAGLGIAYGPIVIALLLGSNVGKTPLVKTVRDDHTPTNPDGWIDVLVGHDGNEETNDSVLAAVSMLGPGVRRLRFAGVLDYEMGTAPSNFPEVGWLENRLREAADQTGQRHVEIVELSGRADTALVEHAIAQEFQLLVVAHRHHRLEVGLFGSTVTRLARTADIPILIGPPAAANRPPETALTPSEPARQPGD